MVSTIQIREVVLVWVRRSFGIQALLFSTLVRHIGSWAGCKYGRIRLEARFYFGRKDDYNDVFMARAYVGVSRWSLGSGVRVGLVAVAIQAKTEAWRGHTHMRIVSRMMLVCCLKSWRQHPAFEPNKSEHWRGYSDAAALAPAVRDKAENKTFNSFTLTSLSHDTLCFTWAQHLRLLAATQIPCLSSLLSIRDTTFFIHNQHVSLPEPSL